MFLIVQRAAGGAGVGDAGEPYVNKKTHISKNNDRIGITIPGIPGAHTQGATLDELRVNLKEVLERLVQIFVGAALHVRR